MHSDEFDVSRFDGGQVIIRDRCLGQEHFGQILEITIDEEERPKLHIRFAWCAVNAGLSDWAEWTKSAKKEYMVPLDMCEKGPYSQTHLIINVPSWQTKLTFLSPDSAVLLLPEHVEGLKLPLRS